MLRFMGLQRVAEDCVTELKGMTKQISFFFKSWMQYRMEDLLTPVTYCVTVIKTLGYYLQK